MSVRPCVGRLGRPWSVRNSRSTILSSRMPRGLSLFDTVGKACVALWLAAPCASAAADGPIHHVRIVYAASDGQAADLEKTLKASVDLPNVTAAVERVSNIDVNIPFTLAGEEEAPLARIFVDTTRSEGAWLYVVDATGRRVFARSVPRLPDNPALEDAQIGEIVRGAVQALSQGAVIGIAVPPAPVSTAVAASETPPIAEASEPARDSASSTSSDHKDPSTWTIGAFYGVGLRADAGAIAQGPGLSGSWLSGRHRFCWGGFASAQYQPHRIARAAVSAQLYTAALRAGPMFEAPLSSAAAVQLSLAGGADVVSLSADTARDDVVVNAGRTLFFAALQSILGLRYRVSDQVAVTLSAAVDVDLIDTRFTRQEAKRSISIEDPWTVRPSLLLGVGLY
jgi:hypothetical protein